VMRKSGLMKRVIILVSIFAVLVAGVAGGIALSSHLNSREQTVQASSDIVALQLTGDPMRVESAMPSEWYEEEWLVTNIGEAEGVAFVHLKNLVCFEDAPGAGVATAEPELVAEEGGWLGEVYTSPLGVDRCDLATHIDAELWFDSTLKLEGKLSDLVCQSIELGTLSGVEPVEAPGGGWGGYFTYSQGSGTLVDPLIAPLIAGQTIVVGEVRIWDDTENLYVIYDATGWTMEETALYVGDEPPAKLAPGKIPYKHPNVNDTVDNYGPIPLPATSVYIAAHAAGTDGETAWAFPPGAKVKLRLHFPDIDEDWLDAEMTTRFLSFEDIDNDGDGSVDEDPRDGIDNDNDGKVDEDPDADDDPLTVVDEGGHFDGSDPNKVLRSLDHWPTNAYMGDYVTFDLEFILSQSYNEDDPGKGKKPPSSKNFKKAIGLFSADIDNDNNGNVDEDLDADDDHSYELRTISPKGK